MASCRTGPPLPPLDLSTPGWQVMQGQAVWKPPGKHPELAGDLLLATNSTGDVFVQLIKTPFPIVTAEILGGHWQIQFGTGQHVWRGPGIPPKRFPWFQLANALAGKTPAGNWRFTNISPDRWRLENPRSGESLEGGFFP